MCRRAVDELLGRKLTNEECITRDLCSRKTVSTQWRIMAGAARWDVHMRSPECLLFEDGDASQLEIIVGGLLKRHETT